MLSRLQNFWLMARERLWFTPASICLAYALGVAGILAAERGFAPDSYGWGVLYEGDVRDAKSLIAILLSAMITMTTLAISITVVVLGLSATQLGPRLIKNFMADRHTQVYIGTFFGTVTACFVLTGILHNASLATPAPRITISAVIVGCFAALFILLGFVNHVARASIADHALARLGRELFAAIDRLSQADDAGDDGGAALPPGFGGQARQVFFPTQGYVQSIDYGQLLQTAEKEDIYIRVTFRAGRYLLPGESGLEARPETAVTPETERKLLDAFIIGSERTATQDLKYSMRHMVEIALRALSPGINDPFTAVAAINQLSAAIARLFRSRLPSRNFKDSAGLLRVIGTGDTAGEIVQEAFSPIRHAGQGNPVIVRHLLEKLALLLRLAADNAQRETLHRELALIKDDIQHNFAGSATGRELLSLHAKAAAS